MEFKVYEGTAGKKPNTDNFKATAQRVREGKENHIGHRTSLEFRLDKAIVCAAEKAEQMEMEALMAVMMKSRTAASMLGHATMRKVEVMYDTQTQNAQLYPMGEGSIIAINPNRPEGELIVTLAKEVRRAWQQQNGALANPMAYEPDQAILVNRAEQADAFITAVRVAWELNLAGECEAWDHLTASPMASIVRGFEEDARKDFRSLNNGKAARTAYDRFFEKSFSKTADRRVIQQMLLDDKGYMKAEGKKAYAAMDMMAKIGEMPFSTNYMQAGKTLPNDAIYCKVEDRSNANFLWFIKFERQYQAKEMQMTQEVVKASAKIVNFSAMRQSRMADHPAA